MISIWKRSAEGIERVRLAGQRQGTPLLISAEDALNLRCLFAGHDHPSAQSGRLTDIFDASPDEHLLRLWGVTGKHPDLIVLAQVVIAVENPVAHPLSDQEVEHAERPASEHELHEPGERW